jgi:hypothetical protein
MAARLLECSLTFWRRATSSSSAGMVGTTLTATAMDRSREAT